MHARCVAHLAQPGHHLRVSVLAPRVKRALRSPRRPHVGRGLEVGGRARGVREREVSVDLRGRAVGSDQGLRRDAATRRRFLVAVTCPAN